VIVFFINKRKCIFKQNGEIIWMKIAVIFLN